MSHVDEESKVETKHPERQGKQDKQLLDTFWDLAATADDKRIEAAGRLIDIVTHKQTEHQRNGASEALCEEVLYTLKRLVRGLASARKGARQGFAVALAQLLEHVEQILLADVLKLIQEHLEIKGLKSEEKQSMFGKAFAYLAIIQSGKLQKEDGRFSAEVIKQLQNIGVQKGFLEDLCFRAVTDLISRSTTEVFEEDIWPTLKPELRQGWGSCSPYTLALLITSKRRFPSIVENKFMQKHWGHTDLLDATNYQNIARIVVDSTLTSHPNPHAVCDILLSWVMDRKQLPLFWKKVVDEYLCSSSQDECVFLAFRLLEAVLPECSAEEIRIVFSKNLLKRYISSLANRQAGLYAAAVKLSETLGHIVKSLDDANKQLAVVQSLLLTPGHFNFDEITKSRTVYMVISNFNSDAVKLYLSWLKELFVTGTADIGNNETPDIDSGRQWVAMQVLSLVRNPRLQKDMDWLSECFQFLFLHAFFTVKKRTKKIPSCDTVLSNPVSDSLRQLIAQHFYNALGVVCNLSTKTEAADGDETTNQQGELWVYVIVKYAQDLLESPHVECAISFSDEAKEAWQQMLTVVAKLCKKIKPNKSASAVPAFQLLFLHVGLQMFSETQQAVDILDDLHGCYDRALNRRKSIKKIDTEEPEWVEVVTEILLSLLSKPSHLLRTVVDGVFKMICPQMTPEALQLLLNVLDPTKSDEEGNMEITQSDDEEDLEMEEDEEEEEEEDDDDDDSDSDSEEENKKPLPNGNGNHAKKKNGEDSAGEVEESGDDDEDDDDDEVDDFFRADVKAALGDAAANEDDSDDVASDFDDETMIKLDTALTSLFKAKMADRRKGKKEANTILLHFKLRVLDLLDIFIKRQQSNPLILKLVHPLLVVAQTASVHKDQQVLSEKAVSIYRNKLCRVKKYPHNITEEREFLHETIEEIMQIAKKATSVMTVSLSSAGCLFLIRVLRGNIEMTDPSPVKTRHQRAEEKVKKITEKTQPAAPQSNMLDVERIGKLYASALEDFMTHRTTSLHPLLFSELIERFPNQAWYFAEDLVKYVTTGCQLYRKTQACRLLALLMSSRPVQSETSQWSGTSEKLTKELLEFLQSTLVDGQVIKPKFLLQIFILLREFANTCHSVEKLPDLSELTAALEELQKKIEVSRSGELSSAVRSVFKAFTNSPVDGKVTGKKHKRKHKRNKKNKRTNAMQH